MDYNLEELSALLAELQQPRFRAKQVYAWLLQGKRPEEMTNLPKSLREALSEIPFGGVEVYQKYVSQKDGTIKYLFAFEDGNLVEGVLMHYSYGNTLCLSTQVGCRMGCKFCASTLSGCVRNVRRGEMLGQIAAVERDQPPKDGQVRTVTNIVLMGSGEPLDNYDEVLAFLRQVTAQDGLRISPRNISISTCGLVDALYRFMEEAPSVTLSVSLHAYDDAIRSQIMPVNNRYPIKELLRAANAYHAKTGRRVIFEYALIHGVNDSETDADGLAKILHKINCHVNLIPLNPVKERDLTGSTRAHAAQFVKWLEQRHISATVRREMGADIKGACGQLRRHVLEQNDKAEA